VFVQHLILERIVKLKSHVSQTLVKTVELVSIHQIFKHMHVHAQLHIPEQIARLSCHVQPIHVKTVVSVLMLLISQHIHVLALKISLVPIVKH
jgi:hypothetical protein